MNEKEKFGGSQAKRSSLLGPIEIKFVDKKASLVPKFIETYHLTLSTILWSALIILFSWYAQKNLNWLWLVSLMILFQYITDLFDGAIGRYRNTGLIKWGYYMDHFLDYIFLGSIVIGYSFISSNIYYLMFILLIFGSFMVNYFLAATVTSNFKNDYLRIGPSEVRMLFIIINILIIFFGTQLLEKLLFFILALSFAGLIIVVYKTHKQIWKIDMENKNNV